MVAKRHKITNVPLFKKLWDMIFFLRDNHFMSGTLIVIFCLLPYLLKVHLHHFSKIKIHTEVSIVGINVFLNNFACFVLYPYLWLMDPDADPGGPKTYGSYGSGFRYATLVLRSFKVVWHKQEGEDEEVVGSLETSEYILGKNWRDLIPVIKVHSLQYIYSVGT